MLDAHLFFAGGVMLLTFVTVSFGGGVGVWISCGWLKRPRGGWSSLQVRGFFGERLEGRVSFGTP